MTAKRSTPPTAPSEDDALDADNPALQGEGNYTAPRRHRKSVERFVDKGEVDAAADAAQPRDDREAQELERAEAEGRSHARK